MKYCTTMPQHTHTHTILYTVNVTCNMKQCGFSSVNIVARFCGSPDPCPLSMSPVPFPCPLSWRSRTVLSSEVRLRAPLDLHQSSSDVISLHREKERKRERGKERTLLVRNFPQRFISPFYIHQPKSSLSGPHVLSGCDTLFLKQQCEISRETSGCID